MPKKKQETEKSADSERIVLTTQEEKTPAEPAQAKPAKTEIVTPSESIIPVEPTIKRPEGMSRETAEGITRHVFKQVKSVLFGLLSPKMIKKMASAKIVTPELYDKEGYPVDGGLMDIRLGVIDPGLRCKTCGSKLKECIGHFGYVELARPVVHLKFVPVIYLILKSTCGSCGRILVPQEKHEKFKTFLERIEREEGIEARRKAIKQVIESLKTTNKCPHCKAKQIKVKIEKPTSFVEDDRRIMPVEVRARLERVPDQDCELFGLNPVVARPEWMILTVLAIPPVTVRPSITLETGERSEDDLTHKLGDIVRINQRLFENINAGAPEIIIEDLWDLLQYHVTTFFDNNVPQLPPARHRSGQPLKTITERIKSKEGRIRHNLAGKRTNFCARTVISPDPMIRINEVGVPRIIAMKLTVPEIVNDWNMAYLKKFVNKGPGEYPGANYIIRPDGKKKKITEETKEAALEELQPGYVVERHLLDGDISIFNRQPSLHRMSMMCHRVKVLPGRTLRLNPAVCAPYNADFDGDEMNLHIPQSEEGRAEAELLMEVQTQIVSPKFGISVIGCTQDGISGNYLLTRFLTLQRKEAIELLATVGITDFSRLPRKETITGTELFSLILPEDFHYTGKLKDGSMLVIKEGKILEGFIDSKAIGGDGEGLMLRSLHKQYGPKNIITILNNISRLGIETLLRHGFTASSADVDLVVEAKDKVKAVLDQAEQDSQELIKKFHDGSLELLPSRTLPETLELCLMERLNKARNMCGEIVNAYAKNPKENQTLLMVRSGARASVLSLVQMGAMVGQQALRGKRVDKGYKNRTLSCFKPGDLSPAARGFVANTFKSGLNPKEFFFCSMAGRDSLMDTALRTPKSGYLYRRLANAMQDLRVEYDNTVRDAAGRIIQFEYGEDGVDVAKSESGKIDVQRVIDQV